MARKSLKTTDGTVIEFDDAIIGTGAMKEVYFATDDALAVAFYKTEQNAEARERVENIIELYSPVKDPQYGEYWKELYCWPTRMIVDGKRLGLVMPRYPKHFFFADGPMKGKEKQGLWFTSPKLRKLLDKKELGDWRGYFQVALLLSRAVRRMHASGLAHSDLSYKNVLIDPMGGHTAIIDIDGLVVPNRFAPDVVGTPGFIAPEVLKTLGMNYEDRTLPSRSTDLHALAVLVYMYLLYRHPLQGVKIHASEAAEDELISMGERALFVEDSKDESNRPDTSNPLYLPWTDVDKLPYTLTGPYLSPLFERAFVDGLHDPTKRPGAYEWEDALVRTADLLLPCENESCEQRWFVFHAAARPVCPFCQSRFRGSVPVLNMYSSRKPGNYTSDNHRLIVRDGQYLYPWHTNRSIFPNEKLSSDDKKPVGYFRLHQGEWVLVNQRMTGLRNVSKGRDVPIGAALALSKDDQIRLSDAARGVLVLVQIANE